MKKINIMLLLFILSSCSTTSEIYNRVFVKKEIDCPLLKTPSGTEELIINSLNYNHKTYIGFRGIKKKCYLNKSEIEMNLEINLRSIRKIFDNDDLIPLKVSLVSVGIDEKEYDRDDLELKLFLKSGSQIVERKAPMFVLIPEKGISYIGIFEK